MTRLARFAARLYPRAWRQRYGAEFDALLDDSGATDGFDVLKGAARAQLLEGAAWKWMAGFALAGALASSAVALLQPNQFVARGAIRATGPGEFLKLKSKAFSRSALAKVIHTVDLYAWEQNRAPLEDVIEEMRSQLRTSSMAEGGYSLSFQYSDPHKAQRAAELLLSQFEPEPGRPSVVRADSNRSRIVLFGCGAGLGTGILVTMLRRLRRNTLKLVAAYSLAGGLLAGAGSLLVPDRYESSAVLLLAPGTELGRLNIPDEDLISLMRDRNLYGGDREGRVPPGELLDRFRKDLRFETAGIPKARTLTIRYIGTHRASTQWVVNRVLLILRSSRFGQDVTDIIDNASYPELPVSPNRTVIILLGLGAGVLYAAVKAGSAVRRESGGVRRWWALG